MYILSSSEDGQTQVQTKFIISDLMSNVPYPNHQTRLYYRSLNVKHENEDYVVLML